MRPRSVSRFLIPLAAVAALVSAACAAPSSGAGGAASSASSAAPTAAATKNVTPIKIGLLSPLSGPQPDRGKILQAAAQAAIDDVNKDGAINGRPLQLVVQDDAFNTNTAVTAAQRLIQDGVVAITGMVTSAEQEAVQPVGERSNVVIIGGVATATGLVDGKPFAFRASGGNEIIGPQIAQLAIRQGAKKVAILRDDSSYGQTLGKEIIKGFQGTAVQIVTEQVYKQSAADVTPQILNVQNSGADSVVFFPIQGSDAALVARTMVNTGVKLPIYAHNGVFTTEAVKLGAQWYAQLPAVYGTGALDTARPEVAAFYDRLKSILGFEPPPNEDAAQTYDSIRLLAIALKKSNGEGGSALAKALETIDRYSGFAGAAGSYESFSATKHTAPTGDFMAVYKFENGKFVRSK